MINMLRSILKRLDLMEEDFDETRLQPLVDSIRADLLVMIEELTKETI